jgi:F-type H+-transporting ATPase subunit b
MDIEWLKSNVFPFINFLIFAFLLYKLAKKPVTQALNQRADDFVNAKEDAQKSLLQAQEMHRQLELRLNSLDNETNEIMTQAKLSAQREADEIIEKAKGLAKHIVDEAHARTIAQAAELVDQAKREILSNALQAAESKLQTVLTSRPDQANALLDEAKKQIKAANFEGLR